MAKLNQNKLKAYFKAFTLKLFMKINKSLIIEIYFKMYVNRIDDLTFQRI